MPRCRGQPRKGGGHQNKNAQRKKRESRNGTNPRGGNNHRTKKTPDRPENAGGKKLHHGKRGGKKKCQGGLKEQGRSTPAAPRKTSPIKPGKGGGRPFQGGSRPLPEKSAKLKRKKNSPGHYRRQQKIKRSPVGVSRCPEGKRQ